MVAKKDVVFKAGDYLTRNDLENDVRNKIGLTIEPKEETIQGTENDLKRLQLKHGSVYWGIKCVLVDSKGKEKEVVVKNRVAGKEVIKRGKKFESKLK